MNISQNKHIPFVVINATIIDLLMYVFSIYGRYVCMGILCIAWVSYVYMMYTHRERGGQEPGMDPGSTAV